MGNKYFCNECGGYTVLDEDFEILRDTCECRCINQEEFITHLESCERCKEYLKGIEL